MVRAYWRRVSQLALQDTLRALSLDSTERAVLRVIGTVVGVAVVWWATKGGTTGDLAVRIAGTVAILTLFPAVYLWKFFATPAKIDKEARDRVADLTSKLDIREKRERLRTVLWELREEGVKLRNEGKITRVIDSWTEQFHAWHAKVLEQSEILSVDLRHSLEPIDKIGPESNEKVATNDPFHQKRVSVMSEMLARLYRYLDRSGN